MFIKESHRNPITSGLFYPAQKEELQEEVNRCLSGERGSSPALILPHASYHIIGPACGRAWLKGADRKIDRILLMGPVHREPEKGLIFPQSDLFSSPLGDIPLDRDLIEQLTKASDLMKIDQTPHEEEHCLELTLPFISTLFPEARIIPCLAGNHRKKEWQEMAGILHEYLKEKKETLLTIITTNLSSYNQETTSETEKDNFMTWLPNPLGDRKDIAACGAPLISLYSMMNLQKGSFQPIEQFKRVRKEGKSPKAVYYGTFFQDYHDE